jgi:hypothetical protein
MARPRRAFVASLLHDVQDVSASAPAPRIVPSVGRAAQRSLLDAGGVATPGSAATALAAVAWTTKRCGAGPK